MGVFSRLGDIINSNLNAMLDRAEDPEKIVRLIIQEMEDTLVEVRASAARGIADKKALTRKISDIEARAAEWDAKAELAVRKNRDDLAKGALTAKRKAQEMADLLRQEIASVDGGLAKAEEDMRQLQAKLQEAKAKQKTLELRRQTASDQVRVRKQVYDGRIDDALSKFDKFERRIDALEGEAEALVMGRGPSLQDEFSTLEAEDAVSEELASLKRRVADSNGANS